MKGNGGLSNRIEAAFDGVSSPSTRPLTASIDEYILCDYMRIISCLGTSTYFLCYFLFVYIYIFNIRIFNMNIEYEYNFGISISIL